MSLEKVHLRKLLQLFYSEPRRQRSLLLSDIRQDERKLLSSGSTGGDFHTPFWADAKDHVAGNLDLREQVKVRVASNKSRSRLYPLLAEGFLSAWNEKIRWRNEKFEVLTTSVKAPLSIPELNAIVKVENVVAVKIPDGSQRVIYPYFSEAPILQREGARLGLWAMKEALTDFEFPDFRIIDVLRSSYFRPEDNQLYGNEREIFLQRYRALLDEWRKLGGS